MVISLFQPVYVVSVIGKYSLKRPAQIAIFIKTTNGNGINPVSDFSGRNRILNNRLPDLQFFLMQVFFTVLRSSVSFSLLLIQKSREFL